MAPTIDISNKEDFERAQKLLKYGNINYEIPPEFIYVPSIELYVAKEGKTLDHKNRVDAQKILHAKNQKMLTILEFKEFLKYTKVHFPDIYNEIIELRYPLRGEYLDAYFKVQRKNLIVNYHIFDKNGKIVQKSEILDKNTLIKNEISEISLENWLENSTKQGLPTKKIKSGDLVYKSPRENDDSIVSFYAQPFRICLECDIPSSHSNYAFSIRACYRK